MSMTNTYIHIYMSAIDYQFYTLFYTQAISNMTPVLRKLDTKAFAIFKVKVRRR